MKPEDKELLRDLCGRLPYGVCCEYEYWDERECEFYKRVEIVNAITMDGYIDLDDNYNYEVNDIKPYLFPMSMMDEYQRIIYGDLTYAVINSLPGDIQNNINELYKWLNENHFDYNGLIDKGLAINATGLDIY